MGCFSYICKECGEGIKSTSQVAGSEGVRLSLIKNGKVVEEMVGIYNSYGAVFDPKSSDEDSLTWDEDWSTIVDICFDDTTDGIAAVHTTCDKGEVYTTQSDNDPNQGWEVDEDEDEYDYEDDWD